jgi:4-amino-4-deoxy-L-arabinose transferase-like glycosyltransferase
MSPPPTPRVTPRGRVVVLALMALAILARLIYVMTLERRIYWYDGTEYSRLALGLLEHGRYVDEAGRASAFWPPGYPLFLAAVYRIFGPSVLAIRVAQSVLGSLIVALVFAITRRLASPKVGYLAAAATAVYPLYIYSTGAVLPIVLQTALVAGAFLLVLRASEKVSVSSALAGGLLAGWAVLTAPSSFLALLLFVPWLAWVRFEAIRPAAASRGGGGKRGAVVLALCLLLPMVLLPGGWAVRNYHALGGFTLVSTNGGYNLWIGNYPGVTAATGNRKTAPGMEEEEARIWRAHRNEVERDAAFFREGRRYVLADLPHFFSLTLSKAIHLWRLYPQPMTTDRPRLGLERLASILSYGLLLPFSLLWLLLSLRRKRMSVLVLGIFAVYSLIHGVFLSKVRFRLPIDVFVIAYGTTGFMALLGTLRGVIEGRRPVRARVPDASGVQPSEAKPPPARPLSGNPAPLPGERSRERRSSARVPDPGPSGGPGASGGSGRS